MKKNLPFFSYLFHPIFIPVLGALFYFILVKDRFFSYEIIYLLLIEILITTVFIPLLLFYLLVHFKKIDGIMVSKVSQRKIPLIINTILLFILILKVITKEKIPELYFFYSGSIISCLISLLFVFFKQKASLHMMSISGLTVFVFGLSIHFQFKSILLISVIILLNGMIASSRLSMKAHTFRELILGFLIGLIPQLYLLNFWL